MAKDGTGAESGGKADRNFDKPMINRRRGTELIAAPVQMHTAQRQEPTPLRLKNRNCRLGLSPAGGLHGFVTTKAYSHPLPWSARLNIEAKRGRDTQRQKEMTELTASAECDSILRMAVEGKRKTRPELLQEGRRQKDALWRKKLKESNYIHRHMCSNLRANRAGS